MRTSAVVKTLLALNKRTVVSSFNGFRSVKLLQRRTYISSSIDNYTFGQHVKFAATPFSEEKKENFKERTKHIAHELKGYPNHLLFLSYPTRVATSQESLRHAAQYVGMENMQMLGLSNYEQSITPGHCLVAFIDAKGNITEENTFSLRPDMSKPLLYKTKTAHDERLPAAITNHDTIVRPARHTSLIQELENWAETAFYAYYVHRKRSTYPLNCLLKPLNLHEQKQYFNALNEMKKRCNRYSLLDHLHPQTGESTGQIVTAENCTVISRLFEKLMSIDLQERLGNNPTPQLVKKMVIHFYLQMEREIFSNSCENRNDPDEFARVFNRV